MAGETVEVIFVLPGGAGTRSVAGTVGRTLMETAVDHDVPGIIAECGGACSCATCHVYVGSGFPQLVGPKDGFEDEMLTGTAAERREDSRLSCQIVLDAGLSGLRVTLPDQQY